MKAMSDACPRFQVNTPNAVFEAFGDEIVAVNVGNGSYYSLRDSAASIWALLSRGLGIADVVRELSRRFEAEGAVLAGAGERLVGELQSEGLIVPVPAGAAVHFFEPGGWAGVRADFSGTAVGALSGYGDRYGVLCAAEGRRHGVAGDRARFDSHAGLTIGKPAPDGSLERCAHPALD